jgi:hypothetical protein
MALFKQPRPNLRSIVNFTIEHDPNCSILVVHRLMAALKVDNAQTTHRERNRTVRASVLTFIIGPAMDDCRIHPANPPGILLPGYADDSAHLLANPSNNP